ncbi:vacuolar protein sorting-associated protein [Colletotrichum tofieldiae]|nr:vacuolar protein sorting-associated protein [Colletotrichum tofieldiae]
MTPYLEDEPLNRSMSLKNLDMLNKEHGRVFFTSKDNVESRPEWLHSHAGIPGKSDNGEDGGGGETSAKHTTDTQDSGKRDGYSEAPAVLILVDKGSGIVDAFWFFFYSYNLGQTVLNIRFGNHVGDWEHCMVRFENGKPRGVFFSEHSGGQAYTFHAVEKRGVRPVIYSAVGSHAMYANPGDHPYVLPFNLLKDVTDRGPLWDPAKNAYSYWYYYNDDSERNRTRNASSEANATDGHCRNTSDSLVPTSENPAAPTSWFHYDGTWGDKLYGLADTRQWRLFNQYHYVAGPRGPKFKRLDRKQICSTDRCEVLQKVNPKQTWYG